MVATKHCQSHFFCSGLCCKTKIHNSVLTFIYNYCVYDVNSIQKVERGS